MDRAELAVLPELLHAMIRCVRQARQQELLQAYWTDLLFDLESVSEPGGTRPFVWGLRQCGTFFAPAVAPDDPEYDALVADVRYWSLYTEPRLYYVWEGGQLREIPPETAGAEYAALCAHWARKEQTP